MSLQSITTSIVLFLFIPSFAVAENEEVSATTSGTVADGEYAAAAKQILRSRCHDCHGGATTQADLVILDRQSLLDSGAVVPGDIATSIIFERITTDDDSLVMPQSPLPRLSFQEIDVLRKWIESGAPAFPDDVVAEPLEPVTMSLDLVFATILRHAESQPRADRPFVRYFSLAHLVAEGATSEHLELHRDALAKAVNHLSRRRAIVRPTVIDEQTGSLFAVDIRDLGWDATPFAEHAASDARSSGLNLWDITLLDYPYGVALPGNTTFDQLAEIYLEPADLVRPVAFVRADWFVSAATQPPLYEDFLRLPPTAEELRQELGVASLESGRRGGVTISGVSKNNRVVERHRSADGSYWLSVDFQSSTGRENMFHDPVNLKGSGGEFIFSLPNGLQGYYLADARGNRLPEAPTSIVTDSFAQDRVVRNGLACMRCHDSGMKRFTDVVRPSLEKLNTSAVFDLRRALELYPEKTVMDRFLDEDENRFLGAMREVLGRDQREEPLTPVAREFLEAPVSLSRATAEAGLPTVATLRELAAIPHFAALGLVPLSTGGQVRRDMWEDFFDEVVQQVGIGTPIVPIDGLLRADYPTARPALDVVLRTDKPGNVLRVGEKAQIVVENRSNASMFIELVGTSSDGLKVILTEPGTTVSPGGMFAMDVNVQPGKGREEISLLASVEALPPGRLLRGRAVAGDRAAGSGVADRVIHDFYQLEVESGHSQITATPASLGLVKRSLTLETN